MEKEKKDFRKELLEKRAFVKLSERREAEKALCEGITGLSLYASCDTVLSYASYGTELSTDALNARVLKDGKRLFLPKVYGKDMVFFEVKSEKDLAEGFKGIPEPLGNTAPFIYELSDNEKVMVIMPGVGFDKEGNRLGYGGGFYDRYMREKPLIMDKSIAVGFKLQETDKLPADENDVKPSMIMLF